MLWIGIALDTLHGIRMFLVNSSNCSVFGTHAHVFLIGTKLCILIHADHLGADVTLHAPVNVRHLRVLLIGQGRTVRAAAEASDAGLSACVFLMSE